MPFPFVHKNGRICCSNPDVMCDSCKAKVAAEARGGTSRAAEGKRHSAQDQQHLDQAAGHLVKAGANVPDEIDGEDFEADSPTVSASAPFKARYAAEQTRLFAELRAATRALEADVAARVPRMRTLEECVPPDPYREANPRAAERADAIDPTADPAYRPYGQPADGYAIHLAVRHLEAQDAPTVARPGRDDLQRDANGIPDGYAAALAARSNR